MNIKKIKSLLDQIEKAEVVTIDDSPYLHSVEVNSDVSGDTDNEILRLNWHDAEGQEFDVKFIEQNLNRANFSNNQIYLCDHEGDPCVISLYNLTPEPIVKNWEPAEVLESPRNDSLLNNSFYR